MYFEAKLPGNTGHSGSERIYIKKCFMTAYQDPNSNPKYSVIDNQGSDWNCFRFEIDPSLGFKLTCIFSNCSCMIDGKANYQSKFLTGSSKMVQKFSVGALVFKDLITPSSTSQVLSVKWAVYCICHCVSPLHWNPMSFQQLYMHCEMSKGPLTPTPASKACNYDPVTKK